MRQPVHAYSAEDEEPQGTGQPLLAVCLPLTCAQCLSLRTRRRLDLVPLAIADRVAEHQHTVDVLPTPTHARSFQSCFDDQLVGAFDAPRTNGPSSLPVRWVLHVRFTLLQVGEFLLDVCTGRASGHPAQVSEHPRRSLVLEPVQ